MISVCPPPANIVFIAVSGDFALQIVNVIGVTIVQQYRLLILFFPHTKGRGIPPDTVSEAPDRLLYSLCEPHLL